MLFGFDFNEPIMIEKKKKKKTNSDDQLFAFNTPIIYDFKRTTPISSHSNIFILLTNKGNVTDGFTEDGWLF